MVILPKNAVGSQCLHILSTLMSWNKSYVTCQEPNVTDYIIMVLNNEGTFHSKKRETFH